jgi:hypothetical protein
MLFNSSHEFTEPTAAFSQPRRARSESLITDLAIGFVALAVLLCIALFAPAPWTAGVESGLRDTATCQTPSLAERVPCLEPSYDAVSEQPAKGATAPLVAGTAPRSATGSIPQD